MVAFMGYWSLARVEDAVSRIAPRLSQPGTRRVALWEALGLLAGRDVFSPVDLPPYPKATMDGYAVRSCDCEGASHSAPAALRLLGGKVRSGEKPEIRVGPGEAVVIETGGYLPQGADAVVRLEDAEVGEGLVYVFKPVAKYENVSLPGEELRKGDPLVKRGYRVMPWHVAAADAAGLDGLDVIDVAVALVCTGDEFVRGDARPFTRWLVAGWLAEHGLPVRLQMVVPDSVEKVAAAVSTALGTCAAVVVCGGSSKGPSDVVHRAVSSLEPSEVVRGVAIRPGRTASLYAVEGKLVVSMSGLPAAAMSTLELVLKPLLGEWLGARYPPRPRVRARLARRVTAKHGYRCFVRVRVERAGEGLVATPLVTGGSGSIRSLVLGNGFLVVPEDVEGFDEGGEVEVELYGPL